MCNVTQLYTYTLCMIMQGWTTVEAASTQSTLYFGMMFYVLHGTKATAAAMECAAPGLSDAASTNSCAAACAMPLE